MPLTHETPVFSVDKLAMYPMTADPSGGTATYGARVYVPGVRTISASPDVLSKELFGDNAVLARTTKLRGMNGTAECAKWSLDIIKNLIGGTLTDSGSTPNMISTLSIKNTDFGGYFKLEAQILGVELPSSTSTGDVHLVWWKAKLSNFDLGANMEDYSTPSFDIAGVQRSSDGKIFDLVYNETAAALSA